MHDFEDQGCLELLLLVLVANSFILQILVAFAVPRQSQTSRCFILANARVQFDISTRIGQ
jgi:hypothetical protein